MAETPADVRKDIALTRSRISETLQELEQKLNVREIVKENPWPAIALAVGAGVLLSGSRADVKAAAATVVAAKGASGPIAKVLDGLVLHVITALASDVKRSIGVPRPATSSSAPGARSDFTSPSADGASVGAPRAD